MPAQQITGRKDFTMGTKYGMRTNLFSVTFQTKKGGDQYWRIDVEDIKTKDALKQVERMWNNDSKLCAMHRFHITIKMLRPDDEFLYHYFSKIEKPAAEEDILRRFHIGQKAKLVNASFWGEKYIGHIGQIIAVSRRSNDVTIMFGAELDYQTYGAYPENVELI